MSDDPSTRIRIVRGRIVQTQETLAGLMEAQDRLDREIDELFRRLDARKAAEKTKG